MAQRNYANLPEIKQKKDEEIRAKELAERKAASTLYAKELDARRRAMLKKRSPVKKTDL